VSRVVAAWFILLVSLGLRSNAAAEPSQRPPPVEIRLKQGDDPRWSARDWDDRDWDKVISSQYLDDGGQFPGRAGIYWVRFQIEQSNYRAPRPVIDTFVWPRDEPGSPINSLFIAAVFSFELYWDGHLIASSGVVGNDRASEVPGLLDHLIPIPPELLGPGRHQVAMRVSSYHYTFSSTHFTPYIAMENYPDRLVHETREASFPLIGMALALLAAVTCAVLYWLVDRRRPMLLLSLLSVAIAAYYFLIAWRWLHNDPYPWLHRRYAAITADMTLISLLIPWLLLEHFTIPRRVWWLAALAPFLVISWWLPSYYWNSAVWLYRSMLGCSLLMAGWAVWRRRSGAVLVLIGVLIALAGAKPMDRSVLTPGFFITFGALVLFIFGSVVVKVRTDRRRAQQELLSKARLEMELLKKNLQPHFVLNTLTALTEVIEHDSAAGVKLIDDLASEFRSLSRMSGEQQVPLARELELCRAHLRMASVRTGRDWTLDTEGIDETFLVPPSIFLTLIENGLIHQRIGDLPGIFVLRMSRLKSTVRFRFLSPGTIAPAQARAEGGTGIRYVKARLEESFPGRWTFTHQAVPEGWETLIEILGGDTLQAVR